MAQPITTITARFMLFMTVNCYLVAVDDGFVLIDTGPVGGRAAIENALLQAGCQPGRLKQIILTHGDFDHCGNAAYLRDKFNAPIAMPRPDAGMVENGDMFASRQPPGPIMKAIVPLVSRLPQADRFTPDAVFDDGADLAEYGLDATAIALPGHCRGNTGILTAAGDLFCGDLFGNLNKPEIWSLVDDAAAMQASAEKVKTLDLRLIYPGHGKPFTLAEYVNANP
jgi:hydroxyacylglutathione hydrolase